jgi:hypothetical protein
MKHNNRWLLDIKEKLNNCDLALRHSLIHQRWQRKNIMAKIINDSGKTTTVTTLNTAEISSVCGGGGIYRGFSIAQSAPIYYGRSTGTAATPGSYRY